MNKQELIDKAVEKFSGKWPAFECYHFEYRTDTRGAHCPYWFTVNECPGSYSREDFEQRARDLGWINGYRWGAEYPTNGKKPDLPDDTEIYIYYASGRSYNPILSRVPDWRLTEKFRIVDERYKPKDQPVQPHDMVDNSWHERGEIPPVGVECEYNRASDTWVKVWVVAKHAFDDCVIFSSERDKGELRYGHACCFRPIKSERDLFVEAARPYMPNVEENVISQLYYAGFRAPE